MARNILRRLAAKQLAKAAKAAGDVVAAQVSQTSGPGGKLREVGSLHDPGVGLSRQDVKDLLRESFVPASLDPSEDAFGKYAARRMRALNEIEQRMPIPVAIPWSLPVERNPTDIINRDALENLSIWLSALSRAPKEVFKRTGLAEFQYGRPHGVPEGSIAGFLRYPVGDTRRRMLVPDIAWTDPHITELSAPWAVLHEAGGHSLVDNPELYPYVLDFLEQAQWRFPAKRTSGEPLSRLGYATTAVREAQPDLYTWKTGRAYAPADYEELSRAFSPLWPEEGRPLGRPPSVWTGSPYQRWPDELYAETHPDEDLAEAAAARILRSHPELLRGLPDAVRRELMGRALALRKNVRYEPITELLKAAGVPLAWLLYLLQRRYDQEGGSQGGTRL